MRQARCLCAISGKRGHRNVWVVRSGGLLEISILGVFVFQISLHEAHLRMLARGSSES